MIAGGASATTSGHSHPSRIALSEDGNLIVAGAGIGGLATALALARRGIRSHVLERRSSFSGEGAGIQIGPNGSRVLNSLGLSEKLRQRAGTPEAIRIHAGRSGKVLNRLPLGSDVERRYGAPYWVAHRADLHGVLLEAVHNCKLITLTLNAEVRSVNQSLAGVCVEIAGGQVLDGAGLIAADGLWSGFRKLLFGAHEPRFSGRCAARAVITTENVRAEFRANEVGVWLAPKSHVVHYPVRGGRELALVVVHESAEAKAGWSCDIEAAQVQDRVREFAPGIQELVAAVPAWRQWALYDLPEHCPSVQGRVALLGDAAHPIMPFLAQGGVMALEDAEVLAHAVATRGDIVEAFGAYQAARAQRTARVQEASRRSGWIYHLPAPAAVARDLALRSVPGSLLLSQYGWLYGWRPPQ